MSNLDNSAHQIIILALQHGKCDWGQKNDHWFDRFLHEEDQTGRPRIHQWQQAPKHIFKNVTGVWNHFQPGGFSVTRYDYATAYKSHDPL